MIYSKSLAAALMFAGCTCGLWSAPAAAFDRSHMQSFLSGSMSQQTMMDIAIDWFAETVVDELALAAEQRTSLDSLVQTAKQTLSEAEGLRRFDHEAMAALPLLEQVSLMRTMAQEADSALASLEVPLADFYDALSDDQKTQLHQLIASHTANHGRRERRAGRRHFWRVD